MNNRTTETLNKIKAKQKLGLPLTRYENAMIILYGETATPASAEEHTEETEKQRRERFVEKYLKPLIVAMGLDIINVIYRTDGEYNESVTLFYESGYTVVKDVTADSLLALVRDVIKLL